jgi:hypothetical protein
MLRVLGVAQQKKTALFLFHQERQEHREAGLARPAGYANFAPVGLGDLFGDGQPQSSTAFGASSEAGKQAR